MQIFYIDFQSTYFCLSPNLTSSCLQTLENRQWLNGPLKQDFKCIFCIVINNNWQPMFNAVCCQGKFEKMLALKNSPYTYVPNCQINIQITDNNAPLHEYIIWNTCNHFNAAEYTSYEFSFTNITILSNYRLLTSSLLQ